jgi:hypothetical protein
MRIQFVVSWLCLCIFGSYCPQSRGQEVPAGTIFEVRLREGVSSRTAKRGNSLHATLVAPVQQEGRTLLPAGTRVNAAVDRAHGVGLGFVRDRASLRIRFDSIVTRSGQVLPIDAQLLEVENARETLRHDGTIVGIRATDSYGHQATGMVSSLAAIDPLLTLFAFAGSSSVLRFPEAEINYPAGTEFRIKLLKPVNLPEIDASAARAITTSEVERASLSTFVTGLPYRTRTQHKNAPSDVTNLVFLGTQEQLVAAFHLAGWAIADRRDSASEYRTVQALAEDRGYPDGPVSLLLLDGKKPALVFEKTLNTVEKRHHLRVWLVANQWNGQTAWTSAATHDTGIGFAKKTVIHRIDPQVDNEREKVVDDLLFSGCVDGFEMVERPRVPRATSNASGDRLLTDGRAAVLHLTNCERPGTESTGALASRASGNPFFRGVRQFDLTLRNVILRDNMGWQVYRGGRLVWKVAHRHAAVQSFSTSLLATEEMEGGTHLADSESLTSVGKPAERRRTPLPEVAFSLSGGEYHSRALGNLFLAWQDPGTGDVSIYEYPLRIEPGVTLGMSVTLHPSHLLSHTLFFNTTQANLITGIDVDAQVDRLQIRTTGYQAELNLAPARWRLRPFVTGGGNLTSYHFKNIKLSKKSGVFQFGLRRVGTIVNAFSSARVAPMDGGKIFDPGVSYGGGFKFRISRLMELRSEYRETYARDPDFFNAQSVNLGSQGYTSSQDTTSRRHGNFTFSLSFTP